MKNGKLKKSNIGIFPKELVHGFGQKLEIFPSFYFGKISQQIVFDNNYYSRKEKGIFGL